MNEPIPDEVGVIVLPGTVLFPRALLPLYIFEPRYQLMLDQALESGRVFAVGTSRPDGGVFPVGGAGVIRACVRNPDGTSNLVLQGIRRVRFVSWTQTEPYRVARAAALSSHNISSPDAGRLTTVVKEICATLAREGREVPPQFENILSQIADPDAFSDAMVSALVANPELRRKLFEELDVSIRLRGLVQCLLTQLENPDETA